MKTIIAGGRHYTFTSADRQWLTSLHNTHQMHEVITGGASGADTEAHIWAKALGIATRVYPADWRAFSKAAGPIRNAEMLCYATNNGADYALVILFPGGPGTANMFKQARRYPRVDILQAVNHPEYIPSHQRSRIY